MVGIIDDPLRNKAQLTPRHREIKSLPHPVTSSTAVFIECSATPCTVCLYPMVVYTSHVESGHNSIIQPEHKAYEAYANKHTQACIVKTDS